MVFLCSSDAKKDISQHYFHRVKHHLAQKTKEIHFILLTLAVVIPESNESIEYDEIDKVNGESDDVDDYHFLAENFLKIQVLT